MMRATLWFFTAILALGITTPAQANGRFPASQYVLVGPGTRADTIVLRATFGLLVSDDAGASFHYVCEEALGYGGETYDPPVALDTTARLHVGLVDGLATVSANRCDFSRVPVLEGLTVGDLDSTSGGAVVLAGAANVTSTTNTGGDARARVYRSDDGGDSFRALGDGVASATVDTVEAAPANPMRVYVTMRTGRPAHATFYRSDDGGITLTPFALPMADEGGGAFIAAVDPTDPDTVYVRIPTTPTFVADAGSVRSTVLVRTHDGGQNWSEVVRSHGSMLGFAISDDGRTIWFGGPNADDRLQRSDDAGASFHQVSTVRVQCLRQHAGVLYVCADFTQDGFALARSSNGGTTLETLLQFADVQGAFSCPATSPEPMCGDRWRTLRQQYFTPGGVADGGGSGTDAGVMDAGAMDAGVMDAGGTESSVHGGCSARPMRGQDGSNGAAWLAALALTLAVGLRRRATLRG